MNKRRGRLSKALQLFNVAFCYLSFGLGALFIGLFFAILHIFPFPSAATKQHWIRTCIHKGCLTFIRMMRLFGLITYSIDSTNTLSAERNVNPTANNQKGLILIANHPSLIDAVMIFAMYKNLCCFVKGSLWNNVFTGAVARLAGFIPNHTVEAVELAVTKLHAGENLLIFPEGTRSQEGRPLHFKRGASNIAVAANADILPLFINFNPAALKKGDKWYNIPDSGGVISIQEGELLILNECIETDDPAPLKYRKLTRFLIQYYEQWMMTGVSISPSEIKRNIDKGCNDKNL